MSTNLLATRRYPRNENIEFFFALFARSLLLFFRYFFTSLSPPSAVSCLCRVFPFRFMRVRVCVQYIKTVKINREKKQQRSVGYYFLLRVFFSIDGMSDEKKMGQIECRTPIFYRQRAVRCFTRNLVDFHSKFIHRDTVSNAVANAEGERRQSERRKRFDVISLSMKMFAYSVWKHFFSSVKFSFFFFVPFFAL